MADLRGLILNDPRIRSAFVDDTLTTATQAGSLPGSPVDQGSSSMVLRTSGSMAAGESVTVDVQRGGFPGIDQRAAGFSYTRSGVEYYWDPPSQISGFEYVTFTNSGSIGSPDKHYEPCLCVLPDGSVLLATRTDAPSIHVRSYTPDTDTWALEATLTDDTITTDPYGPCLVSMGGTRVHLYHSRQVSSTHAQVVLWVSEDSGATWTKQLDSCLDSPFGAQTGLWLRAVRLGSQVIFSGAERAGTRDLVEVFRAVSSDGGYLFSVLDVGGGNLADCMYYQPIVLDGSGIQLSAGSDNATGPALFRDGSAFTLHTYNSGIDDTYSPLPSPGTFVSTHTAIMASVWAGEDGAFYWSMTEDVDADPTLTVYRSLTGRARSFDAYPSAYQVSGTEYPQWISTVETRGLTITAAEVVTENGGVDDGSIAIYYQGGHTTHPMPPGSATPSDVDLIGWDAVYLPLSLPTDNDWNGTGTGTVSLEFGGLEISCTTAQTQYYEPTSPPTADDEALLFELDLSGVASDGHTGTANQPRVGARFIYEHGANEYRLTVQMGAGGLAVYNDAIAMVADVTVDMTNAASIRVEIYRERWAVWYRVAGSRTERAWTLAGSGGGGTNDLTPKTSAALGNHTIQWGVMSTAATNTATLTVSRAAYAMLPSGDITDTGTKDLPKYARPMAARPISIPGGLAIEAQQGPAKAGDQWVIGTGYQYGFDALDDPSPLRTWRSTADGVDLEIVWDLTGHAADTLIPPSIAIALMGANLNRYQLIGRTHAGVDTTLLTAWAQPFDVEGTPTSPVFAWTRSGRVLTCTPSHSSGVSHYIGEGELVGCRFVDAAGGKALITENTGGVWDDDATQKQIRITLDADDDPSTWGASGTGTIHLQDTAAWKHDNTGSYRYLKLKIPSQTTREGYYEIGSLVLGRLHLFGRQYSNDRHQEQIHNVQLTTRRDGSRHAYSYGQQRRAVEFAWREGIDETEIHGSHTRVETSGGEAVAVAGGTARLTRGLYSMTNGPAQPVVYLPRVPSDVASDTVTQRDLMLYGRVVSQYSTDTILGDEGRSELVRSNTWRIEEEL